MANLSIIANGAIKSGHSSVKLVVNGEQYKWPPHSMFWTLEIEVALRECKYYMQARVLKYRNNPGRGQKTE